MNDGTSLNPGRIGAACLLVVVPVAGLGLWQLPLGALVVLLGVLLVAAFGQGIYALRSTRLLPAAREARPAPSPVRPVEPPAQPVRHVVAPADERVVVEVADELGEAITGLLTKVDAIDRRQRTLELGVQRHLAGTSTAAVPAGRKAPKAAALPTKPTGAQPHVDANPELPSPVPTSPAETPREAPVYGQQSLLEELRRA